MKVAAITVATKCHVVFAVHHVTNALYFYNTVIYPYTCFGLLPAILRGVKVL